MKNIKDWNKFVLNELRTETYAKIAKDTGGYPWRLSYKDDFGQYKKNPKAEQEGRINRMALNSLERDFSNEFKDATINNGGKEYRFTNLKFESNYASYTLAFEEVSDVPKFPKMLYIHYHPTDGYYIQNEDDNLDEASKMLLADMFKYMGQ